jgi:aspartyl-tRNA(Asn)/glutamyl-tRNA(Gln) amidotransferase subunit A
MTNTQTNKTAPIHYLEATMLAALIRTRQLSSREVVQAHLDRTEAINPKINAVVTLMGEAALEAADAAGLVLAVLIGANGSERPGPRIEQPGRL